MALVTSPQGQSMNVPDEVADDYIAQGWTSGVPVITTPLFPEGEPAIGWKADELRAYAGDRRIDLSGAKTKPELLDAIAAGVLLEPEPPDD